MSAKKLSVGKKKYCANCGYVFGFTDEKYNIGFGRNKRVVCGQCRDRHYNGDKL